MSPEERFNQQVWEILQSIKEETLATVEGSPVKYRVPNFVGVGIIPQDRRIKILHKLEELKAITIHRNEEGKRIGSSDVYYFFINQPKFDEIYLQYNPNVLSSTVDIPENIEEIEGSLDIIISDLQVTYEDILQEKNDSNFYLKIANYGKYLIEHKKIDSLISPLYQQAQRDVADYKKACDAFMQRWQVLSQDLVELAENEGITDHPTNPFINQINELKGRMKETPSYDDDYISYFFRPYLELTKRFKDEGKFELIAPKHFFIDKKRNVEYLLLEGDFDKVQAEWEKFKKVRELQVWWGHYKIMRLAHGVFNLRDRQEYFHNDNMIDSMYLFDYQQLAQGKQTVFLRRNIFEEWIKRLHQYIIPRLKHILSTQSQNSEEVETIQQVRENAKYNLIFYPDDGLTEYRGVQYSFKGKARALLEFLCSSKGTPFSLEVVKERCNPNILNKGHYFKEDKDTRDTVNYIRKKLKVRNSEFF
ncbi:MAG: hypothetical protein ACREBJ_06575, partial [Nitrosotalea sp.]